ncbi:MAG: hypothetical protein J6B06_00535 [Lachnospiraceae bacterium]|nr:hypothetical protein [Lachnospiraceae bacterium]
MKMDGWQYYNHAAIPSVAPHEGPNLEPILDGSIWKLDGKPLLARWTTNWDCGYETQWWYVIKDTPFDISALKSNYRYKINKGKRYFDVKRIDPNQYREEIYNVTAEAYKGYPSKYRPHIAHDRFVSSIDDWERYTVYAGFCKDTGVMSGYALLQCEDSHIALSVVRTIPEYERLQINAALVYGILAEYSGFLEKGYICDGSRNINHETAFQDYLEKYFGFRKAYCNLHIQYNSKIKPLIKLLYPMRRVLKKLDLFHLVHQANGVLKMEEIIRENSRK